MEDRMEILLKLGIKPPYDPAILLLGIYPEETKTEKDMYPNVHCSTICNSQNMEATQMSIDNEWTKQLWYIYTMEYFSAIKMNAFESVLMKLMNLEPTIQSEVSQKGKDKYHNLTRIYRIQKNITEEFIYRATVEKQTQGIDLWTWQEGRRR